MTSKINYDARAQSAKLAQALSRAAEDFEADDFVWQRIRFLTACVAMASGVATLAIEFWPL